MMFRCGQPKDPVMVLLAQHPSKWVTWSVVRYSSGFVLVLHYDGSMDGCIVLKVGVSTNGAIMDDDSLRTGWRILSIDISRRPKLRDDASRNSRS